MRAELCSCPRRRALSWCCCSGTSLSLYYLSTTLCVYSEHNCHWLKIVRIWLKYYIHLILVTKRCNVLLRQYRVNLNNLLFSIVSNMVQIAFKNLLIGCKYLFLKSISTVTRLLILQQTYCIYYQQLKSKSSRVDRVMSPCVYYVNMWSQIWNIFILFEIMYIIYYMLRSTWTKLFKSTNIILCLKIAPSNITLIVWHFPQNHQ